MLLTLSMHRDLRILNIIKNKIKKNLIRLLHMQGDNLEAIIPLLGEITTNQCFKLYMVIRLFQNN